MTDQSKIRNFSIIAHIANQIHESVDLTTANSAFGLSDRLIEGRTVPTPISQLFH